PGVGRYTAGAIASIAFDQPAAILDGNVVRVLARVDKVQADPTVPKTRALLWRRASEIVPAEGAGDFNSALMELGATVCTPKAPKCLLCPVAKFCKALAAGMQERIPRPRKREATPLLRRAVLRIRREERWL